MGRWNCVGGSLTAMALAVGACAESDGSAQVARGAYLGQAPPGTTPALFAPGIVSTQQNEVNAVFTPDGKQFYFSRFQAGRGYTIMQMRDRDGQWTEPEVAPFSGEYSEVDMFVTHDGGRFFFISKRPVTDGGPPSPGYQIWVMDRGGEGWGEPRHLGPTVNFGRRHLYPTVARNGTLYFNSEEIGEGRGDIFRAAYRDGGFQEPESLGPSVNSPYDETDALISPDERFIVFTSVGRPDGFGGGDLYISFRIQSGGWSDAVNLGREINTDSNEFCPMLSPDGRYFFFTSGRGGSDDIYWVDARILEDYEPSAGQ